MSLPLWWEDCLSVLIWCWSACHDSLLLRTNAMRVLSMFFTLDFLPHWDIPAFWTLFAILNPQISQHITSENEWVMPVKERPCNLPHLNTAQKDNCSQSAEYQDWDLSCKKICDPQSTKRDIQPPNEEHNPTGIKNTWRLLLCGSHVWLNFNWRAASQSLFALIKVHRWPMHF